MFSDNLPTFQLTGGNLLKMFECAPDAMVISDQEGRILQLNAQAEKLFGYQREELIGEKVERLVPERLRGSHVGHRSSYQASPRIRPMDTGEELYALRKDGSEFPVEISLSPVETEKEVVIFSAIRDKSQRIEAKKLQSRLEFEEVLSRLSATFINLPAEHFGQEITEGLKIVGETLNTDRATLGLIDPATDDILISHTWARPGFPEFGERILKGMLPWLEKRIKMGEITSAERPTDLPPEAYSERKYMESIGVKSALIVPFHVGGKIIGAMSTDSFRNHQQWDAVTISHVRHLADIFANALARKQADQHLQQAYSEIRQLKEQLERENSYLREEITLELPHSGVVGGSAAIREVLKKAEQVASTDSVVLILGETGTGKELIARTIHEMSSRKKRAMVKINCAALPANLIESEMFGREKGAYTGALAREIGRFELAGESTIFLDEIGELPLEVQSKLLRVLQEGQFERLGSSKTIQVDVRIIAATNRNLQAMVNEGKFREDLFYRLNVFPILMPPLRERPEDIPPLVWHLLKALGKRMGRNVEGVHAATMRDFMKYSWPGNVRELRNVIERSLILNSGTVLRAQIPDLGETSNRSGRRLSQIEAEHLRSVLQSMRWRVRGKGGAAEVLGLKPTTLESRMKKLGIRRPA